MNEIKHLEAELAERLRLLCDKDGKETNIEKTAEILHQFGLLYKGKSPDKISLIQSASFYNAAIVRQPANSVYQDDLVDLCKHVLYEARAVKLDANLILISKLIWIKVKQMRNHVNTRLNEIQTIPCGLPECELREMENEKIRIVATLQNEITEKYIDIMSHVSQRCCGIMGKPPCEYAVTGLGSLARKEITPYSDFEHVIVLEEGVQHSNKYETILEYFRWFSVIFQIIIINLKETIIRSVAVPSLNDDSVPGGDWFFDAFTPCGIKFDGMQLPACKFPLGRTRKTTDKPFTVELIKPVSEMIKYLEKEEDLKNGYHLADILTKSCFVSGDRVVFEKFKKEVQEKISREHLLSNAQYLQELKENLEIFDPSSFLSVMYKSTSCNIKRVVYRTTTLFLSALGRLHCIQENSCFSIVHSLQKRGLVGDDAAHKLLYAVAVACETRLKVYMAKRGQDDFVGGRNYKEMDYKTVKQLRDIVGEQSLADYFSVAYALQIVVENKKYFDLMKLVDKPVHRFAIILFLDLRELFFLEWENFSKSENIVEKDDNSQHIEFVAAHMLLKHGKAEKAIKIMDSLYKNTATDLRVKVIALRGKAECLISLHRFEEAIQYIESVQDSVIKFDIPIDNVRWCCAALLLLHGDCKKHFNKYEEAMTSYRQAYIHFMTVSSSSKGKEERMAELCRKVGLCLVELKRYPEAIFNLKEGLSYNCNEESLYASTVCMSYGLLGASYFHLGKLEEALEYFQKEYDLRMKTVPEKERINNQEINKCKTVINLLKTNQQVDSCAMM